MSLSDQKIQEIIEEYKKEYKSYHIKIDEAKIKKAIEFAVKYHGNQRRDSGELYYYHPLAVAKIISEMHLDNDSIVTAILHDTIEDTELIFQDIQQHFGKEVAKLVNGVTKLTKVQFKETNNNNLQAENFRKLLLAMSEDIRVLLIKLADRLHNMRTIDFVSKQEKRERISLETIEIYAPLAERIGARRIKEELQDICFRVLYPDERLSLMQQFAFIESGQQQFIPKIIDEVRILLKKQGVISIVSGRKKTAYSTWMKMQQKNIGIDQLSDLVAFRVLVNTKEDCYKALGIIHEEYKMVPNNFQDFISTPKTNRYQSLHTVVMGPMQQKVEMQIRTFEMHQIAELGVAAHWRYKQDHTDISDGKKYAWFRELLSFLNPENSDLFLQNTKLAMYYDQVFCFTPKGKLINLPKGATIVDFAYKVHPDIGNKCTGAKINGKMVPLDAKPLNGDQVKILTSNQETVSPSWEKFVVTGKAKGEIQKFTKKQSEKQYIKLGKMIIDESLNLKNAKEPSKVLANICKIFKKSEDELFFEVAAGTINIQEIAKKVIDKRSKLSQGMSFLKFHRNSFSKKIQKNSISIKNLIPGMAIHYGQCCQPLTSDKIVGVINEKKGVTVHAFGCSVLNSLSNRSKQILNLSWDKNISKPITVGIKILLLNQPGSLAVVANEISMKKKNNIINLKIVGRNDNFYEILFNIEFSSHKNIDELIGLLQAKQVVQSIEKVNDYN